MREILFRGKRIDNGKWIVGGYYSYNNKSYIVIATRYIPDTRDWDVADYYEENPVYKPTFIEVIPETVGQYTGVNVGNEKLFEGDIVECHEDYDDSWGFSKTSVVRAVVVWDEENFYWVFEIEKKYRQPFNDWTWDNSFINGNIHDNPELPKGGVEE